MRIFAGCLLVAVGSVLLTQSSLEFHNRYGEPRLESFIARPGIGLTVAYGSDHSVCEVLIEPPRPFFHPEESLPLMSSDTVTEILEEVAPVKARGMSIASSISRWAALNPEELNILA